MDIFTDADLSDQTHDYNPGTAENSLFWTTEVSPDTLQVDAESGHAVFNLSDFQVPDYFTLPNALVGGGPEPVMATVSIQCEWMAGGEARSLRNKDERWEGDFFVNTATLSWSAQNPDGFTYTADPYTGGFATVGTMRNGSFFE